MPSKIEDRLAEYRAKRAQEKNSSQAEILVPITSSSTPISLKLSSYFALPAFCKPYCERLQNTRVTKALKSLNQGSRTKVIGIRVTVWLLAWVLFIYLEFGAIFLLVSLICFIFSNTRTDPKKSGEPSAYSVFNPGCERLTGTFTAEQFERNLRHGTMR